ncbi:S8 family serine peptidase [Nostocoides sp. F2B08]|nr:S8 family serine peptidase [Tetrasphaera sp. F2B08]
MSHPRRRRVPAVLAAAALAAAGAVGGAGGAAAAPGDGPDLDRWSDLRLDEPLNAAELVVDDGLVGTEGEVRVSIRLTEPALAVGGDAGTIAAEQAAVTAAVEAAGGTVTSTVDRVLNGVFATIDGAKVDGLVETGVIRSVKEVADYQLDLSETVPYIGATAVQESGNTGEGITVAVLDSGVDYTHVGLGGGGTVADYEAAYDDPESRDGLFPTDKVVEGFDFVGETWPNGPRTEDDDPIDFEGHGTHVADIIAGALGVAPGASIIGVKVCSAVSPSCNGEALILGIEYAVDQDVDIINMSLGSNYGQAFDDDLAAATDAATEEGVLTVASAGNGSNKPYVTGTPAAAPTALSVAQTQVPGAVLPQLNVINGAGETALVINGVFQEWSAEPDDVVEGDLVYGDGNGGNLLGCEEFAQDFAPGTIVLVDRGTCSFTQKIATIANAGGVAGIIGLVTPEAPFSGAYDPVACDSDSDGSLDCQEIPGYMISQADSNQLKEGIPDGLRVVIDPTDGLALVGTVVGSSSRGPSMNFNNAIKPEIGAPGASVSAVAGTGDDTAPFGGTSGAAPMVAGSAALVLAEDPELVPAQVKAKLVNTAETDIDTEPGAGLAPITRIGGGEVRVDRAIAASGSAWETEGVTPTLSFGFADVPDTWTATKTVTVENYGDEAASYSIAASFRYADDEANGAVTPSLSTDQLTVPAGGSATFDVTLTVDGAKLREWTANSGAAGADPAWLDLLEYDGYVTLTGAGETSDLHLPWHVLPRKAADIDVEQGRGQAFTLSNESVNSASLEVYNLLATSEDLPEGGRGGQAPTPDFRAAGVAFTEVPTEFCESGLLASFAVNTWERQTHAVAPALFEFNLDVDNDGAPDYAVFNVDQSFLGGALTLGDGRNLVIAQDLATGSGSVFFYTDHETNSANTVLNACGEQIGLDAQSIKKRQVGVAFAADIYFGGPGDSVELDFGAGNMQPPLRVGNTPVRFLELGAGETVNARLFANNRFTKGAMVMVRGGAPEGEETFLLQR